jgi:hypothetical protein
MSAPRYEIRTVSDFLNVPEDRRPLCLKEFAVWVELVANLKSMFDGIPFTEDFSEKFVWVDDGKGTATIAIRTPDGKDVWKTEGRI